MRAMKKTLKKRERERERERAEEKRRKEDIWKESRSRNTSNPVIFKNWPFLHAFLQARE